MPMKPGSTKNLLLRLDPGLAECLETVAEVEGRSVSDVVREAITALVEQRRGQPVFCRPAATPFTVSSSSRSRRSRSSSGMGPRSAARARNCR